MSRPTYYSPKKQSNALVVSILGFAAGLLVVLVPTVLWAKGQSGARFVVGPTREIEPGVKGHAVYMPGGDGSRTLWIYFPSNPPAGKLPCVFIAPAGSSCLTGMALGESDQPEQTPYAHNGFVVVAYSLDGSLPDGASNEQFLSAIQTFRVRFTELTRTYTTPLSQPGDTTIRCAPTVYQTALIFSKCAASRLAPGSSLSQWA